MDATLKNPRQIIAMDDPEDERLVRTQILNHLLAHRDASVRRGRMGRAIRLGRSFDNIATAYPLLSKAKRADAPLRVWRVAAVRFLGNAFEGRAVILNAHQVASAFVTLLPVAIGPLKLCPRSYGATPKSIAGILYHRDLHREHNTNITESP